MVEGRLPWGLGVLYLCIGGERGHDDNDHQGCGISLRMGKLAALRVHAKDDVIRMGE
jgi:hypothetical protein